MAKRELECMPRETQNERRGKREREKERKRERRKKHAPLHGKVPDMRASTGEIRRDRYLNKIYSLNSIEISKAKFGRCKIRNDRIGLRGIREGARQNTTVGY